MGMTIDEIIQGIEVIKAQAEWDYPLDWQIVLDGAIDTMRKYQKIEELAEYHMLRFLPKERMSKFQKDTLEVLEDGNDD